MLKVRVIPILTFSGLALVKTKQFQNPRMVGNPIQSARVYNSRGVDELAFIDIHASIKGRKIDHIMVKEVINECYMPVAIGGAVSTLEDINDLLRIGADKVIVKSEALRNPEFITESANFFGSQCITIATDVKLGEDGYYIHNELGIVISLEEFIIQCNNAGAGEFILTSVDRDGMMNGFEIDLIRQAEALTNLPIIASGGGGEMSHYRELFEQTNVEAVGSASIFHFRQFTPNDIKEELANIGKPVRIV